MALREISQNKSRETRNRILKRQTGLVNLAKKAERIIDEDSSKERRVLCEINHPNVTNRRKPLKRSKCYEDLPAVEPVKKSRKRKSTGDEVDQEMVKRLRQAVEQVLSEQEKRAEHLYQAIKSRVKLSMSYRQDKKVKLIATKIEEATRREFGLDQKKFMQQYRRILMNLGNKSYSLYKALLKGNITPSELARMSPDQMILATKSNKAETLINAKMEETRKLVSNSFTIAQRPVGKLVNGDYVEIFEENCD